SRQRSRAVSRTSVSSRHCRAWAAPGYAAPAADSRPRLALNCPARRHRPTPLSTTLTSADLPGLTLLHSGKVRDAFDLRRLPAPDGDAADPGECLLLVATARLSAFDVVLPGPTPGKGEMLCQISNFLFDRTELLMRNHLTGIEVASVLPDGV